MPTALFVLGDSVSMHYGPHLQRALGPTFAYARKGSVATADAVEVPTDDNANGGDSRMCLAYLRDRCSDPAFAPDLLLLNCGLHDVKQPPGGGPLQVPLDEYAANLRAMAALLADTRPRTRLVFATTTPVCEEHHNGPRSGIWRCQRDVDQCNDAARAVMVEVGAPVVDLAAFTLTQGDPRDTLPDGRHFTEPVRAAQGVFLAGWLHALRATLT
mgnify:CR=1 FL=1